MKRASKRTVKQFGLYNLDGVSFFVVGYLLFSLLYGVFGWYWLLAKMLGDVAGWSVNYGIQRYLVFAEESRGHSERKLLVRFSALSLFNLALDYAIVAGLKQIGISPFMGLFIAALFFTLWKFVWYKLWVFRRSQSNVT